MRVVLQLKLLVFPYFSHDSTALCYTEGATQQSTQYRLAAEQWCQGLIRSKGKVRKGKESKGNVRKGKTSLPYFRVKPLPYH